MGLAHVDGNTTLCMASAVAGYKLSFGTDGPPGCYDDLEVADVVVLWGANIADNHPLLVHRLLAHEGAEVLVVEPQVPNTATPTGHPLARPPARHLTLPPTHTEG